MWVGLIARSPSCHDSTLRIDLWYAWCLCMAILPTCSHLIIGDLVWAQEEAKQFFHGLADIVVSGPLPCVYSPMTPRLFSNATAHGLPQPCRSFRKSEARGKVRRHGGDL